MSFGERHEDSVFVREILIERADGKVRLVSNVVGGCPGVALFVENASRCVEDPFDRAKRAFLTWGFSGVGGRDGHELRVRNAS